MNRESLPAMGRVALGLGFVFASLALTFFIVLAFAVLLSLIPFSEFIGEILLGSLLPWIFIVVITLLLVGLFLCVWAPPESETRGVLFWAVGLNVLGDGLVIVQLLALLFTWWPPAKPPLSQSTGLLAGALLLNMISFIFFVVFLKRLSRYLGNGDAEADAEAVLFLFVGFMVLLLLAEAMLVVAVLGLLGPFNFGDALKLYDLVGVLFWVLLVPLAVLALIVGLVALIKYCNLLTSLRDVILRQIAETAADPKSRKSGLAPF
jgi:hypothetical protein